MGSAQGWVYRIFTYLRLQEAIDAGFMGYRTSLTDPLFENLKGDSHFQQMMAAVKSKANGMLSRIAAMAGK